MTSDQNPEYYASSIQQLWLLKALMPDAPDALRDPNHPFWEEYDLLIQGPAPGRQCRSNTV